MAAVVVVAAVVAVVLSFIVVAAVGSVSRISGSSHEAQENIFIHSSFFLEAPQQNARITVVGRGWVAGCC